MKGIGRIKLAAIVLAATALPACTGVIEWPEDGGFDAGSDGAVFHDGSDSIGQDEGDPDSDANCPTTLCNVSCCAAGESCFQNACCWPACSGKNCGDDGCGATCGSCSGGQVCADGQCQQPGICATVTCDDKEWCQNGICICQSGWERQASGCQPIVPTDPAGRTTGEVCAKWKQDFPTRAAGVWTPGPGECDPGTVDPAALDDGIRRLNLYRWLVGLYPTYNQRSLNVPAQACAVMIRANGTLNHQPPSTWKCYTADGAQGAGNSNEAMGAGCPADAIVQYLDDGGVPSLGHRRWLLDPPYLPNGMGQADQFNCTWVMTGGNSYRPPYVALPPAGPVPVGALLATWSAGLASFDSATTTVTLEDQTAGTQEQPQIQFPAGPYGSLAYVAFNPSLPMTAGHDYQVTLTNVVTVGSTGLPGTLTYTVSLINCP